MAQTFTLEQAADRLGLSPEEFKRRLRDEWKSVRSFRDGPTLRFRTADIDELARSLGQASDPGLPLGSPGVPLTDSSEEIPITLPSQKPPAPKSTTRKPVDPPLLLDDDASEDALSVPLDTSGSRIGKKAKPTGDSDVRLDMTPSAKDASDITEELSFELPTSGGSGVLKGPSSSKLTKSSSAKLSNPSSAKLSGPASAKLSNPSSAKLSGPPSTKIPSPASVPGGDDGSSEFELSLDSDSDSFELTLNPDSSAEVDIGTFVPDPQGSRSGIKLDKPADKGVRLGAGTDDSDSDDFELSLDGSGPSSVITKGGRKPEDASSEFELSLDDNSGVTDGLMDDLNAEAEDKGDIFETDFELPVVSDDESGSEVVAVESSDTDLENSDFDIAIEDSDAPLDDESASQVVLVDDLDEDAMVLDEDDVQPVSPSRKRRLLVDDDDVMIGEEETEDGASASKALRGVRKPGADDDDLPIRTGPAPAARWGVLPALFLLPCLVVVVLGGLMMFEMLRGQWGYTQPSKPSDALVRGVAKAFDMKVSD